jgi:hypothetical protein
MLQLTELHILSKTEGHNLLWQTGKLGYLDVELFVNTCPEISVRLFYGRILRSKKLSEIRRWHKRPYLKDSFRGKVFK